MPWTLCSPAVCSFGRATKMAGWLLFMGAMLFGCRKPVEIRQYDQPKPPHRMLGAMVFRGEEAWFFKVTGPREALGEQSEKFQQFVKSVRFGEAATQGPTWDLPEGWKETGPSEARFQTIKFQAGDEECELAVSKLPLKSPEVDEYLLANVNRWRGQIQLSPLLSDEIQAATTRVELAGGTSATLIDLVGTLEPKPPQGKAEKGMGMGRGMMAGPRPKPPQDPSPPPDLKFKSPEGWKEGEPTQFTKLTFEVRDGTELVKISVTELSAEANPLLDNVNRWRGFMKLPAVAEADLAQQLRSIKVGDVSGSYVELSTPADIAKPQTLLGVIAYRGDQAWFVKLQGDTSLASREKTRFEEFVQSIQF